MSDNFSIQEDAELNLLQRLDAWTLQLYAIQHFDEAIKVFCNEIYEGLQCRSVVFFKYLKPFSSLLVTHSEGISFEDIRGLGLNFSKDQNFSPIKDFLRINKNNSFNEVMKRISPNHSYVSTLCVVRGEVKGLFVYTDIETDKLELPYYKVAERILSHWSSEIFLLDQIHNLNRFDDRTGLLNKRTFTDYMSLEVGRAQRIKHPVTFMVIKLDQANQFKSLLNIDRYESLIKMIAKIISNAVRKTDYVGALSETEFGVLLPHMSVKNARNKAKQIQNILMASKYFSDLNLNVQVQFSMCISEYPSLAHDFEDLHLSTVQKLMLESEEAQIFEMTKGESFQPDFVYQDLEIKK